MIHLKKWLKDLQKTIGIILIHLQIKALRFNKPQLKKDSSLEKVGITETQRERMNCKKQIGCFFESLYIAIGIRGKSLKKIKKF